MVFFKFRVNKIRRQIVRGFYLGKRDGDICRLAFSGENKLLINNNKNRWMNEIRIAAPVHKSGRFYFYFST